MLITFLWASAPPHGTWFGVKGIVELVLEFCPRRGVSNTVLNLSSAEWESPGRETLITETHTAEFSQRDCYLGEVHVFIVELRLAKARLCVILHHSHRRK